MFCPARGHPARAPYAGQLVDGVRLVVSAPALFRPVYAGVCIIWALQQIAGFEGVWKSSGIREDFFDKLYGCAYVREALKSGMNPSEIMLLWKKDVECFCKKRDKILLYEKQAEQYKVRQAGFNDAVGICAIIRSIQTRFAQSHRRCCPEY